MYILRIEHGVPSFSGWKQAFDNDPIGRRKIGVRRYRVYQPTNDPNYALVDLEFNSVQEAEACLAALRELWKQVQGNVMRDPQVRILSVVEDRQP